MKFTLSTIPIKNSKTQGNFYYNGPFDVTNDKMYILEGFKDENEEGSFNEISFSFEKKCIILKNDKAGVLPCYYYVTEHHIVISNSFWNIVNILEDFDNSLLKLNIPEIKFLMFQFGSNTNNNTFFKGIKELATGNILKVELLNHNITIKKYWALNSTSIVTDVKEATEIAEKSLLKSFEHLYKNYKDETFGFGNSGGLDSRLIPVYAKKFGLKIKGFTVVEKKGLIKSVTEQNAKKVSQALDFPSFFNYFNGDNLQQRADLDIANNPIGPSQILKNNYYNADFCTRYISGGNGYIIGGNWGRFSPMKEKELKNNVLNYLNKLGSYNYRDLNPIVTHFLSEDDVIYFKNLRETFYNKNKHKKNVDIIRTLHLECINKHSYLGGYESKNATIPTSNMYYPFLLENSLSWDPKLLLDREILKGLIFKNSKELSHIPDQKLISLFKTNETKLEYYYRTIKLRLVYTQGLNYKKWMKNIDLQKYFRSIMERPNELWNSIFKNFDANFSFYNHNLLTVDIIKAKRIIDLIYYKEYKNIDDKNYKINE